MMATNNTKALQLKANSIERSTKRDDIAELLKAMDRVVRKSVLLNGRGPEGLSRWLASADDDPSNITVVISRGDRYSRDEKKVLLFRGDEKVELNSEIDLGTVRLVHNHMDSIIVVAQQFCDATSPGVFQDYEKRFAV